MTTKLKWRLANRPTPDEVDQLFKSGLLTKDEAREILFSLETDEDRDKEGLQAEIKFLRELVNKLSTRSTIRETIIEIKKPYYDYGWYKPYAVWCEAPSLQSGSSISYLASGGTSNAVYSMNTTGNTASFSVGSQLQDEDPFTSIKTF